jgi:tripartite-type tricarboxylate transporter receptor subunit TctC
MIVIRRPLAALIVAALFLPAARGARAQDYPNRPIRLVVAFTAGGTTDFVARLLSERLRSLIGQPIIVDNRPGANGAIAAEHVAKSEPDGYTLFFTTVGAVAIIRRCTAISLTTRSRTSRRSAWRCSTRPCWS